MDPERSAAAGVGIAEKLNGGLPVGLRVLECYPAERPIRELTNLRATLELEYDRGVPAGAADQLRELFARPEIFVSKRTKRKELTEVDIAPMLRRADWTEEAGSVRGDVVVQAQNPGLNPQLLAQAAERYLPELAPDFVRVRRTAILDGDGRDFR